MSNTPDSMRAYAHQAARDWARKKLSNHMTPEMDPRYQLLVDTFIEAVDWSFRFCYNMKKSLPEEGKEYMVWDHVKDRWRACTYVNGYWTTNKHVLPAVEYPVYRDSPNPQIEETTESQ